MPEDFPTIESLRRIVQYYEFRDIKEDENEDKYRNELADLVANDRPILSQEIRTKKGRNS